MDSKKVIQIGVSLALLFGTVWVVSKAWKSGQKAPAAKTV